MLCASKAHLERLYGEHEPVLVLDKRALRLDPGAGGSGCRSFELTARGQQARPDSANNGGGVLDEETRRQIVAFADHAALALDNARMLEDHERRARRDPLTGLLNRGEFHDMLSTAVARATSNPAETLSLAVFDLDHFKTVNDSAGTAPETGCCAPPRRP